MESHPEQTEAKKILVLDEVFRNYESEIKGLSVDVPVGGSINYEEGRLKITFVGPDSQMTEIADGFTFFINTLDGDKESIAEEIFLEETDILEPISEPEEVNLFGVSGYQFIIEGGLGNEINYFVYEDNSKVVSVNYSVTDPNEVGYLDKVDEIVRSIRVEEDLVAGNECVVSGCSGELCGLEQMESTCEALPGAECLDYASCDFIGDECEWVLNEEASRCFMDVEEELGPEARDSRIGHLFQKAEETLN